MDIGSFLLDAVHELNLLCVGIFFFQSGYGLETAAEQKVDYLKGFLQKKPLRLLLIALFSGIVNTVIQVFLDRDYEDVYEVLRAIREFINWYVWVQVLFYLIFFIAAKLIRKQTLRLVAITAAVLIATEILRHTNLGHAYYTSGLAFPAGILIAVYREKAEALLKKQRVLCLIVTLLLSGVFAFLTLRSHDHLIIAYAKNLMCVSAAIFGMILLTMIPLRGKALEYLSEISLEIYLYQFVAINASATLLKTLGVKKEWNFVAMTLIGTMVLAVFFSFLRKKIEAKKKKPS